MDVTTSTTSVKLPEVGSLNVCHLDAGPSDAPAILLLHGSGPGVSAWANWSVTTPNLVAEGYRVIAPDLIGWGQTERPEGIVYGIETWVQQVIGLADALGLDCFGLVGNSLGGRIALEVTHEVPDRVVALALMGSGSGPTPGGPSEGISHVRGYEPSRENMARLLREWFVHDPSIVSDELIERRYQASVENGAHEAYRAIFANMERMAIPMPDEHVRGIRTPTLLIHGRDDKVVPAESSWILSKLLPNADLCILANCGHWTQLERPTIFNEFLASRFNLLKAGVNRN